MRSPRTGRSGVVKAGLYMLALVWGGGAYAEDAASSDGMAVSVVRALKRCFHKTLAASGTFEPARAIDLRPDREGLVVSDLFVEPGDIVVKGQVLARLVFPQGPMQDGVAIKAPGPGTVITAAAVVGSYVSPNAPDPLFRLAGDGELQLKAKILASSLPDLRNAMAATIHVVGLGDVGGQVASIDKAVDPATQLASLHIAVPPNAPLRVGSFARADIDAGEDCGLTVPLSALLYEADVTVVGIVRSNRVAMRRVTTGLLEGGDVEIRNGLSENDQVIARAGTFLREGDHVRSVLADP